MSAFLQYFERELDYASRALKEFERAHPQKARSLRISAGRSMDPDMQRVADSLALISARLNKRLDDTRPEISLDLMRMMCPGFLLGAPSYAVVAPTSPELEDRTRLSRGTHVTFQDDGRTQCTYTVAKDVTLHPVALASAYLDAVPFRFDAPDGQNGIDAVLCLRIESADKETPLNEIIKDDFELYLPASSICRQRLCEALAGRLHSVVIAEPGSRQGVQLAQGALLPSISVAQDGFLPSYLTQSPSLEGIRDFLCYPDKGYFFTVSGLSQALPAGPEMEVRIFLDGPVTNTVGQVDADDLRLNVVPCVNLFEVNSQPTRYNYARDRIPVTPADPHGEQVEILRINGLSKLTSDGQEKLPEITSPRRHEWEDRIFWQERYLGGNLNGARREVSFSCNGSGGSFNFVAHLLCSNGAAGIVPRPGETAKVNQPSLVEMPFELLAEPTAAVSPELSSVRQWDFLCLINGNFGAVLESASPEEALRQALHLSAPSGYAEPAEAIWQVNLKQSIAPLPVGNNVLLASGTEIDVVLSLEALPYPPAIFAYVLNDFFKGLVSYDRFVQLQVRGRGQTTPLMRFARCHGSQVCS